MTSAPSAPPRCETLPGFRVPEQPLPHWRIYNVRGGISSYVRASSEREALRIARQAGVGITVRIVKAERISAAEYVAEFNALAGSWWS